MKIRYTTKSRLNLEFFGNLEWIESLIGCPSQITLSFNYNNTDYTLYGRWRWDDPWTGTLIPNCKDIWDSDTNEWVELPIEECKEEELDRVKQEIIQKAINYINNQK